MSDYIDRNRLKQGIQEDAMTALQGWDSSLMDLVMLDIDEIPAADVEPVRRWVPCSERMPESTDRVLVAITACKYPGITPELDTDRCVKGNWVRWGDNVTHWMPLPEQPEEVLP